MRRRRELPRRLRGRALWALVLLLVAAAVTGCASTAPGPGPGARRSAREILAALEEPAVGTVLVAAHRGAHRRAPENSLEAIEAAIRLGADIVEVDVRATRDGVLVLMHDSDVNRTTNGRGGVDELPFEELRAFRLTHAGRATEEPPPTLCEALQKAKGRILVDLDIKAAPPSELLRAVHECGCLEETLFFSSSARRLARIRSLEQAARVMPRAGNAEEALRLQERFGAAVVHGDPDFASRELAAQLAEQGARLWVNSLGWRDALGALGLGRWVYGDLAGSGAGVIQTDRPGPLLDCLRSAGLR